MIEYIDGKLLVLRALEVLPNEVDTRLKSLDEQSEKKVTNA